MKTSSYNIYDAKEQRITSPRSNHQNPQKTNYNEAI